MYDFIYIKIKNRQNLLMVILVDYKNGQNTLKTLALRSRVSGFPGGAVVGNLPASAGDTGSSPGLGRSHMPRSNQARVPQLLSLRVRSLCSATREAATVRGLRTAMKSGPRLPQLEKAFAQKRRPNTAKNKYKNKFKKKRPKEEIHGEYLS